jgi:hypothetical protein
VSLLEYVPLPHPRRRRRLPRQAKVAATCLTPGCRHWGTDMLPSLGDCPDCGQLLKETRAAVTS